MTPTSQSTPLKGWAGAIRPLFWSVQRKRNGIEKVSCLALMPVRRAREGRGAAHAGQARPGRGYGRRWSGPAVNITQAPAGLIANRTTAIPLRPGLKAGCARFAPAPSRRSGAFPGLAVVRGCRRTAPLARRARARPALPTTGPASSDGAVSRAGATGLRVVRCGFLDLALFGLGLPAGASARQCLQDSASTVSDAVTTAVSARSASTVLAGSGFADSRGLRLRQLLG